MRTRAFVMLGLALLLAGASVYLARNWIQTQVQANALAEPQKPAIETTKIVVAAGDLYYGNKLRREHLLLIDWPKSSVPEGAFHSFDEILGDKNGKDATGKPVDDRVVLRTINKNEPILKNKITGFGGRASLSALLSPGMRATTIRVNDVNGVAGFVLPGDRVDILITRDPNSSGRRGSSNNLVTEVLLQNMKVLGIDQDANEDRTKPGVARAVTLEVTTVQAQKLTLAQRLGQLSLALRHVNTVDAEKPTTITARDLRVGEVNQAPDNKLSAATITGDTSDTPEPVVQEKATVSTKKAVVTKTVTTSKTTKDMASIRIVRGLKAAEYEVSPEKPSFSAPAYSKPLNLLPTKIAPSVAPMAPAPGKLDPKLDPASGGGETTGGSSTTGTTGLSLTGTAPSEPISLLKKKVRAPGDDG